jgi:phage-related minor tail protein
MNNKIKGLTVEIGGDTTKLGKALESVNKKSNDLSSELGEINRQLKFDPKNTELLAQKQKVLEDAVAATSEKLDKLREAEKQVQKQFERGDVSEEQVRALKREIIATEGKMESYKKAAKDAAENTDELGDEAKEAGDGFTVMKGAMANLVSEGLTRMASAMAGLPEATREYRTDMGKLETAFEAAGKSSEEATETYEELQSVLGDSGQAVEAANHLAQLASTAKDLAIWTEIATGVYATFGSSLPIENLMEAANETAKTGTITGGLADALNWANTEGMNFGVGLKENIVFTELSSKQLEKLTEAERAEYEARKAQYEEIAKYNQSVSEATSAEEKFQIALDNCNTEQERQALIASTLVTLYGEASTQYKETNASVIAANEANERWNASLAEVGASVEPVLTALKNMGAILIETIVPVVDAITNNLPIVAVGLAGVAAALAAYGLTVLSAAASTHGLTIAQYAAATAQKVLNTVMNANPIGAVILAVTALIAIVMALVKNWESVSAFFTNLWASIKKTFSSAVKGIKNDMGDLVTSAVNKLKELPSKVVSIGGDLVSGLWKGVKDKLNWLKSKLDSFATSVLDSIKDFFGVHSPSTKTEWLGEMLDEGMAVGVTKNADEPIKAMDKLSSDMLTAASGEGDLTLERRINNTFGASAPMQDNGLKDTLNKILGAIERGQVIMLDGKTLVGSTADRYDTELGQRRVLAERGAL